MRRSTTFFSLLTFVLLASRFLFSQVWVASTGTTSTPSNIQFSGSKAFVRSSLTSGTTVLHYDVLPVGDLAVPLSSIGPNTCRQLWVRYLDNGPNARVTVALKQVNVSSGVITTLLSFDSNTEPASPGFQIHSGGCLAFDFNFASSEAFGSGGGDGFSAYYIEVSLQKTASTGVAGIQEFHIVTIIP